MALIPRGDLCVPTKRRALTIRVLLLATSAGLPLCAGVAHAQSSAGQVNALEESETARSSGSDGLLPEIVVTAERRSTSLQSAPVAAAVLTGEDLENKAVMLVDQLQFAMPSVTVQNFGQGNSFNIRGIGKSEFGAQSGVGVITYRDGVATFPGYYQGEPYYDIASLEVLRGPQGTFAGQNATGGAVFISSRDPDFDGVSGYLKAQVGNYEDRLIEGAITLPLSDTFAARLAFNTQNRDSFFNVTGPYTGHPGRLRTKSGRVSLLWTPSEAWKISFKTDLHNLNYGGYPAAPFDKPGSIFDVTSNAHHRAQEKFIRSVLNVSYTFDSGIVLKSVTGYQGGRSLINVDLDATDVGEAVFNDIGYDKLYSQEFNLLSPDTGRFTWIAGLYAQASKLYFPPNTFIIGTAPSQVVIDGTGHRRTYAAFGQFGYKLTERLQIQIGARLTHSKVENDPITLSLPLFGLVDTRFQEYDENAGTGKIALNFQADDDNFFYAFVARGHKSGGLNLPNFTFPPDPFSGEDVTDFELGWKSTLFDGHVRTQIGGYYNLYQNFQATISDPDFTNVSQLLNVDGTTKLYGFEASAQAVFGNFSFDVGGQVSNSKLGTFFAADSRSPIPAACRPDTGPAGPNCIDLTGREQTFAPKFSFNFGMQYAIDLGDAGTLTPRVAPG